MLPNVVGRIDSRILRHPWKTVRNAFLRLTLHNWLGQNTLRTTDSRTLRHPQRVHAPSVPETDDLHGPWRTTRGCRQPISGGQIRLKGNRFLKYLSKATWFDNILWHLGRLERFYSLLQYLNKATAFQ